MRKRKLQLSEWGISPDAYQELVYFCKQYKEKVRKLAWSRHSPHPDPRQALWAADTEMIEQAALAAAADLYPYLLRNVTEGVAYEYLGVPQGRRQFYYQCRREFFILLAKKKGWIMGE